MDASLKQAFESLERRRVAFIDRVKALPEDRQKKRPSKKAWSPIEVIAHLALAEDLYNNWIEKAPKEQLRGRAGKRGFKYNGLLWFLRKAIPAPTMKEMEPYAPSNATEAGEHWRRVRERMWTLLSGAASGEAVLVHPMLGPMSAEQIVEVFDAHLEYHEKRFLRCS